MILVALGSNLKSPDFGDPQQALEAALRALAGRGVAVVHKSSWYRSAPVPPSSQPWFTNGVVSVETKHDPFHLLGLLHEIERDFGRVRTVRNESRVIDLDLLAYDEVLADGSSGLVLPHPRIAERAFVLRPLREIAPAWQHPLTGETPDQMLEQLPGDQQLQRIG